MGELMGIHERRRRVKTALAILEEVVADVLQEVADGDDRGLPGATVALRAGFPERGLATDICRSVLALMREDGICTDDQPQPGHAAWRLVRANQP